MSGAHEVAEHIEHAAHEGHGGGIGRTAGITMAILGVMLALCAAMVGGARTELIATMVEQSNTWNKYQAQRMKHRLMLTQLATLHALMPSHKELRKFEDDLAKSTASKTSTDDAAEIKAAVALSTKALVEILSPRHEDMERLLAATHRYEEQVEAAEKWAESYEEAIAAYTDAGEHYEWGQLAAEIGIVIASVALLLSNRKAWFVSVVFAAACVGVLGWTFTGTYGRAHHAAEQVAKTKAAYEKLRHAKESEEDDATTLAAVAAKLHGANPAPSGASPAEHHHP